jgi:hypothetical protein
MKRVLIAAVNIYVVWMAMDLIAHRFVLAPLYDATPSLWRPLDQMNSGLIAAVTIALVTVFVGIYGRLVRPKSLRAGLLLGAWLGVALGIASGFGTFIHMPIPLALAWGWFIAGTLKGVVAGLILGTVIVSDV